MPVTTRLRPTVVDRVAIAAVAAPLVISMIRVLTGRRYVASGDFALMETNVRDVGSHLLELGPYSRFDWNHPGPAIYYALAAPTRLFGDSSKGILIGSLALNIAAVVVAALVARHVGGRVALYGTLGIAAAAMHGLGSDGLMSPWNPDLPLLPTLVVLVSAWALACGHVRALPVLALAATFVAQSHVGYVPVVAAWCITAVVYVVVDAVRVRSAETNRRLLQWGTGTLAALLVLWFLPMWQQATGDRGNLQLLASFSTEAGDRRFVDGFKIVASAYGLGAPWLTDAETAQPFTGEINPTRWGIGVVTFVLLAAALVLCIRRRDTLPQPIVRLVVLLSVAIPVEIYAVTKIKGPAYAYLVQWLWIGAVGVWLTLLWLVTMLWPRSARTIGVVTGVGFAALVGVNVLTVNGATRPDSGALQEVVRTFVAPAVNASRDETGEVRVQGIDIDAQSYAEGLQLALAKRGIAARAPAVPLMRIKVTGDHIDQGDDAPTVLTIVGGQNQAFNVVFDLPGTGGRNAIEQMRNAPGFHELSHVAIPATPEQTEQTKQRVDQLLEDGTITPAEAKAILATDAAARAEFALFVSDTDAQLPEDFAGRR